MKNGQKYAKEINLMVNQEYFECSLWSIRNGKKASEYCCPVPESFDPANGPASGSNEFCKKCLCESLEWLNQEYKDPILDYVEREYLSAVIKPFRKKISCIRKRKDPRKGKNYIKIEFCDGDSMFFPNLSNDEMYKGMKLDINYTLEELGLSCQQKDN